MKESRIFLLITVLFLSVTTHGQLNLSASSSSGNYSLTCTNPTILITANTTFTSPVSYTWTNPQLSVVNSNSLVVSLAGLYTLAASSGTILQTLTVSVVINTTQPTISLTASGSITCLTPTVLMTTVSSPTNVSYAWIEPGVGFGCTNATCIAAQAGNYSVKVKDLSNGCQSTATINIIDDKIYPTFNSIGLYTVACPNGTVSLEPALFSSTTNVLFQWKVPLGATTSPTNNPKLTTNAPGEYTVVVTNTLNGCSTLTLVSVYACVGMEENFQKLLINGYPNPVSNVFHIAVGNLKNFNIEVINLSGEIVLSTTNETAINFTPLKSSLYFVTVQSADGRMCFKVLKE